MITKPPLPPDVDRSISTAFRGWLDGMLTEPMTVSELCAYWGEISRPMMRRILEEMEGAKRLPAVRGGTDRLWRVPVSKMPPKYLMRIGLLKPRSIASGHECEQMPTVAERNLTPVAICEQFPLP